MEVFIRSFAELSLEELYGILSLRSEIFIVEQKGCYQDPDGIDCKALHIFCKDEEGRICGCLRLFQKPDSPDTMQIGRVAVRYRRQGMGRQLMVLAAAEAARVPGIHNLFLTGRRSARAFYEACGYTAALPACYETEAEAQYFDFSRPL